MRLEAFFASFSPSFDPVAHRSLTDSQCSGDVFLLPTFLFQFPRSFPSFFSPIGFLWCSHASYCLILDFFLSRSVNVTTSLKSCSSSSISCKNNCWCVPRSHSDL